MGFVWVSGDTPEEVSENEFIWAVNLSAKAERLRQFVGLENTNHTRIVAKATDIVKMKLGGNKKADAASVRKWMVDNVRWGAFERPDVQTVARHMTNWAAISKQKVVVQLMEAAVQRWGRNNLFDYPTKMQPQSAN